MSCEHKADELERELRHLAERIPELANGFVTCEDCGKLVAIDFVIRAWEPNPDAPTDDAGPVCGPCLKENHE